MATSAELLQKVPFLAPLARGDLEALASSVIQRRYKRGDIIFQKDEPGQALFMIERGAVHIYMPSAQGNDLTLAVLGPGDFFGDMSLLDGRPRSASAAAASDTTVLTLERSDFMAVLSTRPAAAMAVLNIITQRLREADEMASDLAFLDVGGRLAKKLLELAANHGVQRRDGLLIDLAITQEELANMIGVTRESVNRNLGAFRRAGLIESVGRRLLILDEDGLQDRADGLSGATGPGA